MKKSLSLLVAIAMVFSMFATVVSAAPAAGESAGEYLKKLGVIQGGDKGDLMEDEALKRQDAAILVARLVLGLEEAEDLVKTGEKTHTYTDVRGSYYDGVLSWAEAEGYMEGDVAGKTFGFDREVTIQEFATVIVRALGFTVGTTEDVDVQYADVVAKAVELGLLAEGTDGKAAAIRGDLYEVIVKGLDTEVKGTGKTLGQILELPGYEVVAPAVAAAAVGAKKVEVKFNQAADKEKVEITVKNGAHTVNIKEAAWAADNKSVVLTFAANLAASENYTVAVKGVAEEELTASFKVEEEKIAEIKFQSDKAALTRKAEQDYREVAVGYVVSNQYGEDISATTSLNATSTKGTAVASNGVLTINVTQPAFYNINEQIHVTLLHASSAFANATLTVSAEGRVSAVTVEGLHHDDEKIAAVGETAADFGLIISAKDQYGNNVTNVDHIKEDVIAHSTNPLVANVDKNDITNKTINNAVKVVLPLKSIQTTGDNAGQLTTAGTATVAVMSISTSNRGTYDVTVKDAIKLDKLTLSQPASAPAGAEVEIPFTAVDQFGAVIEHPTNANVLSRSISGGVQGDVNFVKDVVKNKTALKVKLPSAKGPAVLVLVTQTNEVVRLTINVSDVTVASSVGGIKDYATAILKGDSATIGTGNIVVKDQYGNDFTVNNFTVKGQPATDGQFRVAVTTSNDTVVSVTGDTYISAGTSTTLSGLKKGTATVSLKLQKYDGAAWKDVANGSYNYSHKVVEKGDIKSYEATVAGKIYAGTPSTPETHAKAVEVKGVLEDGTKVTIPLNADNYDVQENQAGFEFSNGKLRVTAVGDIAIASDKTEKEIPVLVLVKGVNTEILNVTAVVSNVAPAIESFKAKDNSVAGIKKENDTTISIEKSDLQALISPLNLVRAAVEVKDQYDVVYTNVNDINYALSTLPTDFAQAEVGKSYTISATTASNKPINLTVVVKADSN